MNISLERLRRRWRTATAFAAVAQTWMDRPALFLAGMARGRPFDGDSAYARLGRILGAEVFPRIRTAGGLRVGLDLRDVSDLMILEELFIDGIYPLESVPFEPDTVIDCGACAGFFTIQSHARYPGAKLHVFEPEPENAKRLQRNLALNHIAADVYQAAVGLAGGSAHFSGRGFGGHVSAAREYDSVEVSVVDFPVFLKAQSIQRLLLKIDIEGAEAELLPAIARLLPQSTALFLETHHGEQDCRLYLQPLLDVGFVHREVRRRSEAASQCEFVERVLLRV